MKDETKSENTVFGKGIALIPLAIAVLTVIKEYYEK